MKINYEKAKFQPITLTIESWDELAAITLAISRTSHNDYKNVVEDENWNPTDVRSISNEAVEIYNQLFPILKASVSK